MAGGGNTHSAFILEFDFTQEDNNHFSGEQNYRFSAVEIHPWFSLKYRYVSLI